ncbi:MAG: TetR/AcrR family transcriptional regulator [Thermanaerothrix sp.]|uniref:TetR/AcrR family transcriptional regulator n=1 Tax=Thermanaerothrix sp. TaxID=2972675 RepID=UPI003C7C3C6D
MDRTAISMRQKILNESTRLFVRRGYDGVSIRDIAEACQMTKAALYYHFEDKEHLLAAVLVSGLETLGRLVEDVLSQEQGTRARLHRLVQDLFTRLPAEQRALIRLAIQEVGKIRPEWREEILRCYREAFLRPLASIFATGQQRGEVRPLAVEMMVWAFLGMLYPFLDEASLLHSEVSPEQLEVLVQIFWEGISVNRTANAGENM